MRCAGKAALIGATVTMVTAGFGTALLAAVTNITFNPNPIIVGYSVNYTAVEDGTHPPAISYEWSYRCINNGCVGNWVTSGFTGQTVNFIESRVGTQEIKCKATYPNPMLGQPQPTSTFTKMITVLGPDRDVIIAGLNTPTDRNQRIVIKYRLQNGDTPLGISLPGYAQERVLINDPDTGVVDSGWVPPAGTSNPNYYMEGNTIVDSQAFNYSQERWDAIPVGSVFRTVFLQNRWVTTDCCGQEVIYYLVNHTLRRRKVSATEWQIEDDTPPGGGD